jgi:ATP-dependent RNA helicase DDX56/DBP9
MVSTTLAAKASKLTVSVPCRPSQVRGVSNSRVSTAVFAKIKKEQGARGSKIKEYNLKFDMKQVKAFRYRMEDALRSVTRVKELKTEIHEFR